LAEDTFLDDDFLRQLMSVGEVDLLVGIPSHNNATTVAATVDAIEECFRQNFYRDRVVIVNVDGGSKDGTPEAVLNAAVSQHENGRGLTSLRTEHCVGMRYAQPVSTGQLYRTLLAAADLLRAKACAVISPASSNVAPAWIEKLLKPVYREKFDFVAPLYGRHKFDGLLGRNLLYPMARAVFGWRVRELHPSDFAFSGGFGSYCVNQDVWHEEAIGASAETWMAITGTRPDFRICQAFLGQKMHAATTSGSDIVSAVRDAVGAFFWCMESQQEIWTARTGSEAVPTNGPDHELTIQAVRINRKRIFELFRTGASELETILKSVLSPETHAEIQRIAALDERKFRLGGELWARILFEFAASYHRAVINRDHLIQALVPLYRGRIYSFLLDHQESSPQEIEDDTEALCLELERQKPYLLERWNQKG